MAKYPNVNYKQWILDTDKPKNINQVCFSALHGKAIKVTFDCKIDSDLTISHVNFYVKFLKKILNKDLFTYEINKDKSKILFTLNGTGLTYSQKLLYLTAMRYLQEFPTIILELFNYKNLLINDLFNKFIEIHLLVCQNKFDLKYDDSFYGHSLVAPYEVNNYNSINLKNFKTNLKFNKESVNSYFGEY